MPIRFTQSCPTCGRRIQVQAALLGHSVACPHCRAEFSAADEESARGGAGARQQPEASVPDPLMVRVEKALARANEASTLTG